MKQLKACAKIWFIENLNGLINEYMNVKIETYMIKMIKVIIS